jgi:hypothetical protein
VRALQAEGDATELMGRQAVLSAFRAARGQSAATQQPRVQPVPGVPAYDWDSTRTLPARPASGSEPWASGRRRPPRRRLRVVTIAVAALLAVCAGLTAAAYAKVLPPSVQNIAHSVLAPIGVPSASPATPVSTGPGQGSTPAGSPGTSGGSSSAPGPASSAGAPTSAAAAGVSVRLAAGRARVAAGGMVTFTGQAGKNGHPVHGARVRLLEQLSTDVGAWRIATTGVTGEDGTVTLVVPHIPASATFRLAGTGKLADVISPAVTITVIPRVLIQQPTAGILTVTAVPTAAGDTVTLLRLVNGTWATAAVSHLSATHEARFRVLPGASYRVLLPATPMHAYALSARITAIKSPAKRVLAATAAA